MYTLNIIDSKTDDFKSIETSGTTFGQVKSQLIDEGFVIDFSKRAYVIAETSVEMISDDSVLGFSDSTTSLTLCMYPKDTKAGLGKAEIEALGFSGMRGRVTSIRKQDPSGFERHLAHLGGNPSKQGLIDALVSYYKANSSAAIAPAKPTKVDNPTAGAKPSLEQRVAALEAVVFGDVSEPKKEDPMIAEREALERRKQEAMAKAKAVKSAAIKRF
jgi:hypothetical protein